MVEMKSRPITVNARQLQLELQLQLVYDLLKTKQLFLKIKRLCFIVNPENQTLCLTVKEEITVLENKVLSFTVNGGTVITETGRSQKMKSQCFLGNVKH